MDSQAGSLADTHLWPIDTEKTIGRRKRFRPKSYRSNTLRWRITGVGWWWPNTHPPSKNRNHHAI